jgi:hypothetical protein
MIGLGLIVTIAMLALMSYSISIAHFTMGEIKTKKELFMSFIPFYTTVILVINQYRKLK